MLRYKTSSAALAFFRRVGREGRKVAPWTVPFAAQAAIGGVAALQSDPAAAAESRYLGLLTAGVLAAIAALVSRRKAGAAVLIWTALLASATAWIAYQGPSRGAVLSLVLTAGLSAAVYQAVRRPSPALTPSVTVPAALGFQLLLRGDLLLPPLLDPRTLVSLLVLPALAGGAASVLASIYGDRRAGLAAIAIVVLAPGVNVTTLSGLTAVAAGAVLARPGSGRLAKWQRTAAILALIGVAAWSWPLGALLALTGGSLRSRGLWVLAAPAAGLAVVLLGASPGDWSPVLGRWAGALILLPAWILALFERPSARSGFDGRRMLLQGGAFMALAAKAGAGPDALAAGLALMALAIPARGAGAAIQRRFSVLVAVGTTLLASYPWTRITPRDDFLELLGIEPPSAATGPAGLAAGVALAVLLAAVTLAVERFGREYGRPRFAALATAIVVVAAGASLLRSAAPTAVAVNSFAAVVMGPERHNWRKSLPGLPVAALVLDSHLIHGAGLEPGTPVAILRLRDAEGEPLKVWRIRAGDDTAEWAAARRDVADLPGFRAPPHWIARLAPDGSFFSRLFRSRFVTGEAIEAHFLTVQLAPDLPSGSGVQLVISRLEIRR